MLACDVEASEAFVALGDAYGSGFPLGSGDDLLRGVTLHIGVETKGRGREGKTFTLVIECEMILPRRKLGGRLFQFTGFLASSVPSPPYHQNCELTITRSFLRSLIS
jgi:hypothetical protein